MTDTVQSVGRGLRMVSGFYGILMIICGVAALAAPVVATLATTLVVGISLIAGGAVGLFASFQEKSGNGRWLNVLWSLLALGLGIWMVAQPGVGAVSLTMLITSILLSQVAVRCWNWPVWKSAVICGSFMLIEIGFVSANLTKVMQGGFVPLAIGAVLLFTMLTWKRGRNVLSGKFADMSLPLEDLVDSFKRHAPVRVRGTAVFLTASPVATPGALLHNLKHNKILHEKVVVLSLQTQRVPRVKPEDSLKIVDLGSGIWRVISSHGFMEQPDVPSILAQCAKRDLDVDPNHTSYFLGRETIVPTRKNMPVWQAQFFALLCRRSQSAMEFFKLPPNRVIELGTQIEV